MAENLAGRAPLKRDEVAKSLYLQQVEQATDMRQFMAEMERVMKSSSDSDESSSDDESMRHMRKSKGDRIVNGVLMSRADRRKDRSRFYNFSNIGKEREWLKDALLNSSEESEDESTPEGRDRRIRTVLKQRRMELKYAKRFRMKKTKPNFMYYSSGLLSTVDRYVHPERSARLPPSASRGRRGRPPAERGGRSDRGRERKTRGPYKPRRGRVKEGPSTSMDATMQDGMLDWEEQLRTIKVEDDDSFMYNAMSSDKPDRTPGVRGRKKLSELNTPEALTALRRRHWQFVVKKDLGKVQRARANAHKEAILQRKRLATACAKHWRNVASQSQKNMKETVWRCKRLSREMQTYWKRYDRAEKDARRRLEKEAEEQRKMDVELMEAKRHRRKLNFLITQTELYAHFMQRKTHSEGDNSAEQILQQLDEDVDPRLAALDTYDSEAMKAQASKNAREAFRAERSRAQMFDSLAGVGDVEVEGEVEIEEEVEEPPKTGESEQPSLFRGTLKGYQLKGMNWLANLYDQGISGILADEMGLGKTVQCIAFLCHVAEKLGVWGPFLVVSPASTLHNWQQEVERFAPDFKVVPYWGSPSERKILRQFWERRDLHTRQAAFHVCITSYQLIVSDLKYLNRVSWQYMILDEAQAIKSSQSMRWKLLLGFSCRNRLLLSGTPIQNSMAELWALLHFIMPTLFDSHEEFNEWFSKDIESHAENKTTMDEKHLSRLHMILKPFMLRRVKKDVENELSDKIEIMVHCPLTIRQKLLYIALKKKIKIEELLHFSVGAETGHNVDKNFTSNLMNLVMQFRKVCNHPELFERRDVRSPFSMHVDDYHMPKLIAEDGILIRCIPSKRHLLYNKLSTLTPSYIHRSLEEGGDFFAFTRFIDLSPMELYRVMICGWLYAIHHIEDSLKKYELLRHRQYWWHEPKDEREEVMDTDKCEREASKDMLLICPDGDTLKQRKEDGPIWKELLFTDPLWISGGPFYTYTDLTLHYMAETMEHRVMRSKQLKLTEMVYEPSDPQPSTSSAVPSTSSGVPSTSSAIPSTSSADPSTSSADPSTSSAIPSTSSAVPNTSSAVPSTSAIPTEELQVNTKLIEEFPHIERDPIIFPLMPTPLPQFLYAAQPKAITHTRAPFAVSRAFAYHVTRHQHAECAEGSRTLARLVDRSRPPFGWAAIQVPDKNQLVSDAGKLTVLDSLLKKLKIRGHRVLIYSQMTKMIDLLEEYMCHRKHKYMRLDGSSKISARRDMVADFQARTDIFVFLLSTRAGGLGINLTAADTVIFYDSDWNPTVDQQAMDRAHRLGQTKQVTVYRLICQGTIEERIMERAREKSEIQRMVISGGNFKVDSLKPKEVVSLLLDDEEIELKYRQKSEEKKREERERKRKIGLPTPTPQPAAALTPDSKRSHDSASEPASPLRIDDEEDYIIVDAPVASTSFAPVVQSNAWGVKRGIRGGRRGRPRGSRHGICRRPHEPSTSDNAIAVAAGAALLESDAPLESTPPSDPVLRGRRGRGRPRSATPRPAPSRRPRRPREPLLVPLAPPPE